MRANSHPGVPKCTNKCHRCRHRHVHISVLTKSFRDLVFVDCFFPSNTIIQFLSTIICDKSSTNGVWSFLQLRFRKKQFVGISSNNCSGLVFLTPRVRWQIILRAYASTVCAELRLRVLFSKICLEFIPFAFASAS